MTQTGPRLDATGQDRSRTNLAVALAVAALVAAVALMATDADGPIWLVQAALGLAAAVVGWLAGGRSPRHNLPAFVALVVGAILFLMVVGWLIAEA